MPYDEQAFPTGVVVFFRIMTTDNNLARSVHPTGRNIKIGGREAHDDDYIVIDEQGHFLGCYPREFVSAILPLDTTGPGNADNPKKILSN
jgi:hypothetical protein